ncbi:hypothetical protein BIZ78_gp205 [Erwinia phage vB_EamM_Caitlin]|uniref:hypothetical protein n=1 Tax=Erwinia phage vB_EamM_Caitlin TaxID=1883379 RepID=UPI00081D1166|nr:hypothetical protein BIZ78_gp205 [Erwinia phage vB_EamM_Caitlin]ANZ48370.1 hypothetical protein CAITLIN_75 [Erwinia phage vB_EamM_Caitlin]
MSVLASLSRIVTTLSELVSVDTPVVELDEVSQLFDAYQKAKKAGDVALAQILHSKWLVATAGL